MKSVKKKGEERLSREGEVSQEIRKTYATGTRSLPGRCQRGTGEETGCREPAVFSGGKSERPGLGCPTSAGLEEIE